MRRLFQPLILALAVLVGCPAAAFADDAGVPAVVDAGVSDAPAVAVTDAGVVTPAPNTPAAQVEADPVGTAKQIVADVKGGKWRLAIAGILAVLFALALRLAPKIFGKTDRGKALAVMVLALLGTLSAALATSTPISFELIGGAVGLAFTAVGGRQWLSRVLWPRDDGKPVAEFLQPWLGVKSGTDTAGGTGAAPPA